MKSHVAQDGTAVSAMKRLPGFRRAASGLEWAVLRRLPKIAVLGTLLPLVGAVGAVLFLGGDSASVKVATTIQIMVASVLVLHWTVVFTVALLCLIVLIAKGPAYVADAYPLVDSDRPTP